MKSLTTFALIYCSFAQFSLAEDKLIFVHSMWRHGDRTPEYVCKGDPNKADLWDIYGGFGELTPLGMEQQAALGDAIYEEYVNKTPFLSTYYIPKEMFVQSTDLNRTLVSAAANMIGMYYNRSGPIPGKNFPDSGRWPPVFVPIPVHTVDRTYVINPGASCARQNWIWSLVKNTSEARTLVEKSKDLMEFLSEKCEENVDPMATLWRYKDTFFVEKIYNMPLIINDTIYDAMVSVESLVEDFQNGLNLSVSDGMNFEIEIGKIRGGPILWEIIERMDFKMRCTSSESGNLPECTWMNKLKYFAYSGHDTTVGAYLTVLGVKQRLVPNGGYPAYSSAVTTELWSTESGFCLKFKFYKDSTSVLEDFTPLVNGCENASCCPYDKFKQSAKIFYPGDREELCKDVTSKSTSFDPDSTPSPSSQGTIRAHLSTAAILLLLVSHL